MIACLTGKLIYSDPLTLGCVVDCAGVGYALTVTSTTFSKLPSPDGSEVRLFTHMQILTQTSSAEIALYGFADRDELDFFRLLIDVSGVGPKAAMAILSLYDPQTLSAIIADEDTKSIAKASGVGAKTAARIVLEIREKVQKRFPVLGGERPAETKKTAGGRIRTSAAVSDARDALIVLGYPQSSVNSALASCDASLPTDELIRAALIILSGN